MSAIPFIISALILFSTSPTQAQQDLGNLRLHEATFLTSHNAHANLAVAEGIFEPLVSRYGRDIMLLFLKLCFLICFS
jgi:hypothetical protein